MNDAARDTARRFAVGDINMEAAAEEHARAARGLEGRLHRHYQAADAALLDLVGMGMDSALNAEFTW